jgi:hypothetical protein
VARGIVAANEGRCGRHDFIESHGMGGKVLMEPAKVVKGVVDTGGEPDAKLLFVTKCFLQEAKESSCAGKNKRHQLEFTQDSMPFFLQQLLLCVRDVVKEFFKVLGPVFVKVDHHVDGVQDPS